jgi:hypothetical protein
MVGLFLHMQQRPKVVVTPNLTASNAFPPEGNDHPGCTSRDGAAKANIGGGPAASSTLPEPGARCRPRYGIKCSSRVPPNSMRNPSYWRARFCIFRFLRPFVRALARVAPSIENSSILCPCFTRTVSHRGRAPLPAHVSPLGPRYFGATFRPLRLIRRRRSGALAIPNRES